MKRYADYIKGLLIGSLVGLFIGLALASLATVFAVFAWRAWYPIPNPAPPPKGAATSPAASPEELTARVENLENDQAYNLRNFEWQLDQKILVLGGVALVISVIAGFMGFKSYKDLEKTINQEVRRALDQALYHLDPTNLRIWVVSYDKSIIIRGDALETYDDKGKQQFEKIESNVSKEMQKVSERIERTGLLNIKPIKSLCKECFDGVTIVPVFDAKMEENFRNFLVNNRDNLDPSRAAFVLYTIDHFVSQTKTLSRYDNLATANMPSTVASMILTVGRGLTNVYPSKKEEVQ